MPKVGVILSGCGVFDGSEIHEAVLALLCLDEQGAEVQCIAPRKPLDVIHHATKKPTGEKRDVFEESARIARGDLVDLAKVKAEDFDAFVLPGGFGAAKNLSTFATEGENCSVDPQLARLLQDAHRLGKPIGLACIAPVIAAKVFGKSVRPRLTIGRDASTAVKIEQMGARHESRDVQDVAVDEKNRIVTTPCYMEAKSIREVRAGMDKLVEEVLRLSREPAAV